MVFNTRTFKIFLVNKLYIYIYIYPFFFFSFAWNYIKRYRAKVFEYRKKDDSYLRF